MHARVKAWPQWAANECPPAHQLHTRTLEEYGKWYMERLASVTDEVRCQRMAVASPYDMCEN